MLFNTLFSNQKTLMTLLTLDTFDPQPISKKTWQMFCVFPKLFVFLHHDFMN